MTPRIGMDKIVQEILDAAEDGRQSRLSALNEVCQRHKLDTDARTYLWFSLGLEDRERSCGWDD